MVPSHRRALRARLLCDPCSSAGLPDVTHALLWRPWSAIKETCPSGVDQCWPGPTWLA